MFVIQTSQKSYRIVHPHTGNTYSVAEKLQENLLRKGHSVSIEKIIALQDNQQDVQKIVLERIPQISGYDALIFGAPVRGFSLSPVMKAYISQIPSLQQKKVVCYVTEFFPYPWMGGNQAITQMTKICEAKNTKIIATGIVNWSRYRDKKIAVVVEEFSKLLSS